MKIAYPPSVVVGVLVVLLWATTTGADDALRQCENDECRRHALSDTWLYCPYCGTELPAAARRTAAKEEVVGNIYKNGEYGFQIELPNERWRFLRGEKLTEELNEDASVGLVSKDDLYSMVIVERMPGVTPEKYLEMVAPSLEQRALVYQKDLELADAEGVRAKWTGSMDEIPFHFYYKVIAFGDLRLQVVSWLVAGNDSRKHQAEIAAIEDSLQLLEAE